MSRRFLGLSESTWRILAAGAVTALWMLVAWTATAWANDCAAYVNNPKNFTGNLQGLIEDCMRTGYVQAIATLLVGGIGGGGIAIAVGKGLKDAGKDAKEGPEGGEKKDGETPEAPPPTTGRDTVPEPCRGKWDEYRKATEEEFQKGKDVATVNNWYNHVVTNHMNNLAKVTIQLGMDAADLASAGAGGIKGGMGVSKALLQLPETLSAIKNMLTRALAHSKGLETLIYNLFEEIGRLMQKGTRLAGAADDAGRLSARAEERISELVAGAAGLGQDVAKYDELVRFARSADSTLLERNMVSKAASAATEALQDANRNHEKILSRKGALDDWAASERVVIQNEDAQRFNTKHEELGNDRTKLQQLQAEHAEAARKAHADWQDKMNDLTAARKELEEARAAAAHLQKAKQEKLLAEQEVRRTRGVRDEGGARLNQAEAELSSFEAAMEEAERAKAAVRGREQELERIAKRLDAAEAKVHAAQTKIDQAVAIERELSQVDKAKALVDEKDAAIAGAKAKKQEFDARPDVAGFQSQLDEVERPYREAVALEKEKERIVVQIVDEQKALNAELAEELERAGIPTYDPKASYGKEGTGKIGAWDLDPTLLPPDREAYYARRNLELDAKMEPAVAENKAASAKVVSSFSEWKRADADLRGKHAKLMEEGTLLDGDIQMAEAARQEAVDSYQVFTGITNPDTHETTFGPRRQEAKRIRQEGEDAMPKPGDPDSPDALTAEQQRIETELIDKRYEAAQKHVDKEKLPGYKQNVADAKRDIGHYDLNLKEAETRLATADADLKAADLSGTGEPLDTLHTLEGAQARYNALSQEQEALRVRYEQLKSGGDSVEAANLKQRIDALEGELARWKDPDVESELARRDPAKYREWKEEHTPGKIAASQAKVAEADSALEKLRADLLTVERKLADEQQKAGGKSTAELEAERDKLKGQIKTKETEIESAKKDKQTHDQAKAQAEKEKEEADRERGKKEAEKKKAEEEKRQADEEVARLQRLQDNPVPPPEDVSWLGQKMHWAGDKLGVGQQWTPYHGSDAEGIANKSHDLRKKFDEGMDAITPDWLTWPFRAAGAKAGELFHKAFGGQSPEEVAAALKHGDKRVKEMKEKLRVAQEEFDALRKKAHDAKAALDECSANNRPPARAESN